MDARSLAVGASLLMATAHCATPDDADGVDDEAPIEELPLDLTVDSVDLVHGALRVRATMVDGSADVSVTLGPDCDGREAGGGLSTASTLIWTLGDRDLADAIGCGLVVRAHARTGRRYATKVAQLGLGVEVTRSSDPESSEESAEAPTTQDDPMTAVPPLDLAQSLLLHRPLRSKGAAFDVSLEVGGVRLEADEP